MKKLGSVLSLCAIASLMCLFAPHQAEARPPYMKGFNEKYGEVETIKARAEELKCGVCHGEGGKNKKVVSDYGKALGQALGGKNVKEAEKIAKAYETIEAKKDNGSDKTYGEELKAGKLPKLAP
ncbi:MAG TPA: hypothetical protein VNQ76_03710 [Planctomicrobium sp.]|nr:hypothetical protein [Planctomicrobium sp.]